MTVNQHQFPETDNTYTAICIGCGLTWAAIYYQMRNEPDFFVNNHIKTLRTEDDCDIRRRKNQLKAFW